MVGLEPGYWVALCLRKGAAPLRVAVGRVQAVDDRGVRVTLLDWLVMSDCGFDMFVPWAAVTSALVATPGHDTGAFFTKAARWQKAMADAPADADESPLSAAPTLTSACQGWLEGRIAAGPVPVATIRDEAVQQGWSSVTLYRAKKSLDVVESSKDGRKQWSLRRPL